MQPGTSLLIPTRICLKRIAFPGRAGPLFIYNIGAVSLVRIVCTGARANKPSLLYACVRRYTF